ncbi:F-box-like domain superfamily [Sesbania bispinosa]|nr:F-box-like domain superfamily [Sesbania bispinosa]
MDLISDLPKHILHDILSRLPEKDAARSSILSKSWKDTWSTSPILVFTESRYGIRKKTVDQKNTQQMEDLMKKRNNFLNSVDSTLQRFHDQGLAVKQFTLRMGFSDPYTLSPLIDYWMELASESGIEVLHLTLFRPILSHGEHYCFPPNILESKSLVKFILFGCLRIDKAFLNHPIKFCLLQVLSLSHVFVGEEQIIQNLISSCPLIEYMTLKYCSGLRFVSIHNLPKLKGVDFRGLQEVLVDAPSLEYFHYFADGINTVCKTNMDKCINLRDPCLSFPRDIIITNQWLLELLLKFPLLERLQLEDCNMSKKIQISSLQLKVFKFSSCSQLEEACIDAPNLYSCSYDGDEFTMPKVIFLNSSSCLEFDVKLDICFGLDFLKLRKFLRNIKPRNVLASLVLDFCYPTVSID